MCMVDVADEEDVTALAGGRGQGGGAVEEVRRRSSGPSREIRQLLALGRQARAPYSPAHIVLSHPPFPVACPHSSPLVSPPLPTLWSLISQPAHL